MTGKRRRAMKISALFSSLAVAAVLGLASAAGNLRGEVSFGCTCCAVKER
jgi:hypothetical protein